MLDDYLCKDYDCLVDAYTFLKTIYNLLTENIELKDIEIRGHKLHHYILQMLKIKLRKDHDKYVQENNILIEEFALNHRGNTYVKMLKSYMYDNELFSQLHREYSHYLESIPGNSIEEYITNTNGGITTCNKSECKLCKKCILKNLYLLTLP